MRLFIVSVNMNDLLRTMTKVMVLPLLLLLDSLAHVGTGQWGWNLPTAEFGLSVRSRGPTGHPVTFDVHPQRRTLDIIDRHVVGLNGFLTLAASLYWGST
jgi:hypothetical protein